MSKPFLMIALSCATLNAAAVQLTEQETRWLRAAAPVLNYATSIALPVDIIVQPNADSGNVPFAAGYSDGRCKLVLSMRGNPDAEQVLEDVPLAEQGLLIEAMTMHELAHCWRYAQGEWHALPAGFVEGGVEAAPDPALLAASKALRETRREEGFADLVALAWVQRTQPGAYARVHDWLSAVRDAVATPHSGHDTRVWLRLADNGSDLVGGATPFDAAQALWRKGLLED